MNRRLMLFSCVCVLLAACSTTPPAPPPPAALTHALPEAMVATIRAAAGNDERELAVQPLRDPMVEDLRQAATRLEAQQHYAEAAAALDKALTIVPEDPALLQERAEAALLLKDPATAEALARRAYSLGAKVGPLCRRHWTTVRQTRLLAGDAVGAAQALTQVEACKVAGPNRF
jgi:tetratricopeptide (TPR) repeat protein